VPQRVQQQDGQQDGPRLDFREAWQEIEPRGNPED
jgi:hypothetical protein